MIHDLCFCFSFPFRLFREIYSSISILFRSRWVNCFLIFILVYIHVEITDFDYHFSLCHIEATVILHELSQAFLSWILSCIVVGLKGIVCQFSIVILSCVLSFPILSWADWSSSSLSTTNSSDPNYGNQIIKSLFLSLIYFSCSFFKFLWPFFSPCLLFFLFFLLLFISVFCHHFLPFFHFYCFFFSSRHFG